MNRRRLLVVTGLIVGSTFSAVACAQTAPRQPSLAERMSSLRKGLTGGSQDDVPPSTARSNVPQVDGQSIMSGGLLGRRPTSQQPATRVPAPAGTSASPRVASNPRAGSATPVEPETENFTLPGLGGSRLPAAGVDAPRPQTRRQNGPPGNNSGNSRVGSTAARSETTPQRTARRSPQHRTALNLDPNDLSRELAGSFPTEPQSNASTNESATNDKPESSMPAKSSLSLPTADNNGDTSPIQVNIPPTDDTDSGRATPNTSTNNLRSAFDRGTPMNKPETPSGAASSTRNDRNDPSVLATQQTPVITTDIRGPRQITVGREATYRVRLVNQGNVAAEGIVATIRIPNWADVLDTTTSQGTIEQAPSGNTTGVVQWQLVRVDAHASETLDIRLVPRSSRPLELGVSYTVAPVGSRAVVEVQEPKLDIHVTGPEEVLYGKPQLFRLTISNPGTGTAENVKIDLLPPGGGEAVVSSHPLGDLAPGANKTVEVELTPREAGKLSVKAHAAAEGGLVADADKEIFCRKSELEVDWRGPDQKYAGTQATYFFRVRNPGTAPAENVTVRVSLPEGAEYAGASEGQSLDTSRREVSWSVGSLGPGDDYYMELKCLLRSPGTSQLTVTAAASGDLSMSKTAQTNVVALADLKLDVSDPTGPVAIGEEAVYEIRVKNRGTSAAHDVNIVALFSDGIEPEHVEGGQYTTTDGRVTFRTIPELPAGRQVALRIRAKASKAGTHVFRAEVLCKDQEIKLAAEETTRFYADELPPEKGAEMPPQQSAERLNESAPLERSVDRYPQSQPVEESADHYLPSDDSAVR